MSALSRLIIAAALLVAAIAPRALAATYYISPIGDDGADGTSPATAWATTARADRVAGTLLPGDAILFDSENGPHASASLTITASGTAAQPIRIGAYPSSGALLHASSAAGTSGLTIYNAAFVHVSDLNVSGSGALSGTNPNCISLWTDGGMQLHGVELARLDASGCSIGVYVGSNTCVGFTGVRMSAITAHHNRDNGILVAGKFPATCYSHGDVSVVDSSAYNNSGNPANTDGWTGSGIVVSSCDGALVTRCVAHDNGGMNAHTGGGPVGIWAYNARNATISHSVSYHNSVGRGTVDGGGFDLDGGASDSVMEYNLAFGNAGPGYLICQFEGNALPTSNNTLRYSVSYLDGARARNGVGGLEFFTPDVLQGVDAYGNTFFVGPSATGVSGQAVVSAVSPGLRGVRISRNALVVVVVEGRPVPSLVSWPNGGGGPGPGGDVAFSGNAYWVEGGAPSSYEWGGESFPSLSEWRDATGQERWANGTASGTDTDPHLAVGGGFFTACVAWDGAAYPPLPNSGALDAVRGFGGCGGGG